MGGGERGRIQYPWQWESQIKEVKWSYFSINQVSMGTYNNSQGGFFALVNWIGRVPETFEYVCVSYGNL